MKEVPKVLQGFWLLVPVIPVVHNDQGTCAGPGEEEEQLEPSPVPASTVSDCDEQPAHSPEVAAAPPLLTPPVLDAEDSCEELTNDSLVVSAHRYPIISPEQNSLTISQDEERMQSESAISIAEFIDETIPQLDYFFYTFYNFFSYYYYYYFSCY